MESINKQELIDQDLNRVTAGAGANWNNVLRFLNTNLSRLPADMQAEFISIASSKTWSKELSVWVLQHLKENAVLQEAYKYGFS